MRKYTFAANNLKQLAVTVVAASLLVIGIIIISWPHVQAAWQRRQGTQHNAVILHKVEQNTSQTPTMDLGSPVAISLPRLNINLPVQTGQYNPTTQTWTIDRTHAYLMQPPTGQTATPIIYGHDIPAVFEHLAGVADNEVLQITNTAGQTLLFSYVTDSALDPTDTSILKIHFTNTVILMTCSGTHFEHRRALQFHYIGVQKAPLALPKVSA